MIAAAASSKSQPISHPEDSEAQAWPPKEHFAIWPGKPPGSPSNTIFPNWTRNNSNRELWIRGVQFPEINVFRASKPNGSALLAFPGGGYKFLSVENEGKNAAAPFNAIGTTLFVLTYRLATEGWNDRSIAPLQDAQRAMRVIRARASDLKIDPSRLGAIGFSAGGHLAADLAVSHAQMTYEAIDDADRLSARPAFVGLIYPVISLDHRISLGSSAPNLLGSDPSPELVAARSPALHVTNATPPSFLAAAFDDPIVLPDNALLWIEACRHKRTEIEAHLFAKGGHGFGFHLPSDEPGSLWPDLFVRWMHNTSA